MIRFPADTIIVGELRIKGTVQMDGRMDGIGSIEGTLILTQDSVWTGKVCADILVIEGTVEGEIVARRRLKLSATARVKGRIVCPQLSIAEGAVVNATINMRKAEPIPLLEHKSRKVAELNYLPAVEAQPVQRIVGD